MSTAMGGTDGLERRLARLESLEEIRRLVGLYALGADRRNDPEIFAGLYTGDAVWEAAGFGRFQGRELIVSELARIGRETIVWTLHYMTSPVIDIDEDGEGARCRWWLWELSKIKDQPGDEAVAHFLGGTYDTRLKRAPDGWRFCHVTLDLPLISPHEPGFKTRP
ncbi:MULTISPECIES: nuclear transport factor 2 family protein [unclassified Xanthobacter]|uniref:nuclear transport factor 2 family protein n=1 Tax=unclassified Xanthobacter TaxID=2623496 RepID=UPI001F34B297|nr:MULTISPECIES: nuclear transport factor 2 family protein [unclassified Xanthobacter]